MNKILIGEYYLDIKKIKKISHSRIRDEINCYYRDMLNYFEEGRTEAAKSIFNSLLKSGYLKNYSKEIRDEKIKSITENV